MHREWIYVDPVAPNTRTRCDCVHVTSSEVVTQPRLVISSHPLHTSLQKRTLAKTPSPRPTLVFRQMLTNWPNKKNNMCMTIVCLCFIINAKKKKGRGDLRGVSGRGDIEG
jgi:hypothetical protein